MRFSRDVFRTSQTSLPVSCWIAAHGQGAHAMRMPPEDFVPAIHFS
jgi:hypothetical protein